jgi:hypothetical protein
LADAPEGAHLQFFQFVRTMHLALQSNFGGHFLGALAEDGRGHAVGRFVHQVACEVL